jgi:hypothetical protein
VYDNGFIEIDPTQCGYSTFLGAGIPEAAEAGEGSEDGDQAGAQQQQQQAGGR